MVEGSRVSIGSEARVQAIVPPRVRPLGAGSRVEWVLMHIAYVIITVFFLAPFVWLFTAAFDAQAKAYIRFPSQPTLDNFVQIFDKYAFATALGNSVFVAVSFTTTPWMTIGMESTTWPFWMGAHSGFTRTSMSRSPGWMPVG